MNEDNTRKATDILLDLESKVEKLLAVVYSQDLTIKTISNKLNLLLEASKSQASKITIEPTNLQPKTVQSIQPIPMETQPSGIRRTSRQDVAVKSDGLDKYPMQLPNNKPEIILPKIPDKKPTEVFTEVPQNTEVKSTVVTNPQPILKTPVIQKILDKNGKAVFMADVEVSDNIGNTIFKGRTNGMGKWMASLPKGTYNVKVSKREAVTKEKLTVSVNFDVDQSENMELKTALLK